MKQKQQLKSLTKVQIETVNEIGAQVLREEFGLSIEQTNLWAEKVLERVLPADIGNSPSSTATIINLNATRIFGIAKMAYKRTPDESSHRDDGKENALVAIIFSIAALETFINELPEVAEDFVKNLEGSSGDIANITEHPSSAHSEIRKMAQSFSLFMKEAEKSNMSIELKFQLASVAFKGAFDPRGLAPYQDFVSLVKLRNAIIHLKAEDKYIVDLVSRRVEPVNRPRIVEDLRSKNILASSADDKMSSWLDLIMTRTTARWACNTASAMVMSVLNAIPESKFKDTTDIIYKDAFQPAP